MIKNFTFILLFLLISTFNSAQQKESDGKNKLAVTIDDLPLVNLNANPIKNSQKIFENLINAIIKNKVPAVGFVNEFMLCAYNGTPDKRKVELFSAWINAGLEVGNHTYNHLDEIFCTIDQYKESILKGEKISRELLSQKGKKLEYFRHPYMHTGYTAQRRDDINKFLAEHGYKTAPVTITSYETVYADAFSNASKSKDTLMMAKIGEDYVKHIEAETVFSERQSNILFKRNINHILLLHANELNAFFLDSILIMLKNRGYTFVSLAEALKDEFYKLPDEYVGKQGLTSLARYGISRKNDDPTFTKNLPDAPQWIYDAAKKQ